jgi:hypothetical protein
MGTRCDWRGGFEQFRWRLLNEERVCKQNRVPVRIVAAGLVAWEGREMAAPLTADRLEIDWQRDLAWRVVGGATERSCAARTAAAAAGCLPSILLEFSVAIGGWFACRNASRC